MAHRTSEREPIHPQPPQRRARPLKLEVDSLTKSYGDTTVVDGLTFTVQPGRITGFLGPNGSGKSTTMKMLLGLASADKGQATIGGIPYRDLPDPARTLGVVLEPNAFHPGRSGRNHLRIQAEAAGIPVAQVDKVLRSVDLSPEAANRRVGTYSLGMKQRLSLALALLGDPPVLVLDEPGNGLDPRGIRTLRDNLATRAANGDTVFVSSHLLSEVEQLADDLVVINEGRLVAAGSIHELRNPTALVRTTAPEAFAVDLERIGGKVTRQHVDTLVVEGLSTEDIGELAYHEGVVLHELSLREGSLEEMFMAWTDDASRTHASPSTKKEVYS
ncbi:MAG: ATP-binding cassette domain-containing protein [Acidimicrobiia bacterium]|nr:ATP-binding cassette domain-containing protein [Acidimicrobiia bacterium]